MKIAPPPSKGARVLIVEDEAIAAESVAGKLQKHGYTVLDIVDNAPQAITYAGSAQPDIILMDIVLKGEQDGISAAEAIYREWRIPVVYMTAFADVPTVERAKNTYPFGYVVKPFRVSELIAVMEIAMQQHRKIAKLEALGAERSDLLSLMVHEFRNPLSTILMAAEMLELKGDQWSAEERATRLQRITSAAQTLSHLIQDVVIAARAEASNFQPELTNFNIVHFCGDYAQELQSRWGDSVRIQYVPLLQCAPMVRLDSQWLAYILNAYLNTVIKFCITKAIANVMIKFALTLSPTELQIKINPEGVFLPELDQPTTNDSFIRSASNASSRMDNYSATLGVVIAHRLVTAQNGIVTVEHFPHQGTTIAIHLPLSTTSKKERS
jgi:K+-sensing histidine kinase KdpD